jgi:hypothetical protein
MKREAMLETSERKFKRGMENYFYNRTKGD